MSKGFCCHEPEEAEEGHGGYEEELSIAPHGAPLWRIWRRIELF